MRFSRSLQASVLGITLLVFSAALLHGAVDDERQSFFESKIRPVLAAECYECHGATKQKGGLRLDYREGILNGGDSGAALVAGDPEKSLLFQSITHAHSDLQMPKDRAKLDDKVVADFAKWIKSGAPSTPGAAPTTCTPSSPSTRCTRSRRP